MFPHNTNYRYTFLFNCELHELKDEVGWHLEMTALKMEAIFSLEKKDLI